MQNQIFTSLEQPPSPEEVRTAHEAGISIFDFDLEQDGAIEAVAAIKDIGGTISAYHIGGGGGRAWGSVKAGEYVRIYREQPALEQLTADVMRLVAMGADNIHFDNTHRMSGRTLEKVTLAIAAGGARLVLKNNPEKWNLVLKRHPEYMEYYAYAAVEGVIGDRWETKQSAKLAAQGLPVYVIAFEKGFDKGSHRTTPEKAQKFIAKNPWGMVILMPDEAAYDSRNAISFTAKTS